MRFASPLLEGRLVRRYKRFLADVELAAGELVTAHTANPGRMLGLATPGSAVWLSHHDDPARKLKYTWQLIEVDGRLVGVNPALANRLVREAIERGAIPELAGYGSLRTEVRAGPRARTDFLLEDSARPPCWVEVKNATFLAGEAALFPDAVTERGRRHLEELAALARGGARAVLCYLVQRPEPRVVAPADAIDPAYADAFRAALAAGVEAIAYRARVGLEGIEVSERLAVAAREPTGRGRGGANARASATPAAAPPRSGRRGARVRR